MLKEDNFSQERIHQPNKIKSNPFSTNFVNMNIDSLKWLFATDLLLAIIYKQNQDKELPS
jgi:hypothetical protein